MAPAECPEGFVKIVHEWLAWEPPSHDESIRSIA